MIVSISARSTGIICFALLIRMWVWPWRQTTWLFLIGQRCRAVSWMYAPYLCQCDSLYYIMNQRMLEMRSASELVNKVEQTVQFSSTSNSSWWLITTVSIFLDRLHVNCQILWMRFMLFRSWNCNNTSSNLHTPRVFKSAPWLHRCTLLTWAHGFLNHQYDDT